MRKIVYFVLTFVLLCVSCFSLVGCSTGDEEESGANSITVFSWEDYIDLGDEEEGTNSILDDFEDQTGIHVNYITFANSEEMYNELEKNPDACDLLCPSEYMIMKMMTEGKLRSFTTPDNYKTYCSQYIKNSFKKLGKKDSNGTLIEPIMSQDEETTYACGYMWGTMGYVYDMDRFDAEEFSNWDCVLGGKFFDKCTVKDSVRDTYIMAVGAVYEDELMALKAKNELPDTDNDYIDDIEYNKQLTAIFNRCDQDTVDKVEEYLKDLRENLYYFEVDNAKTDILRGRIDLYFAWSGDAVYAIDCGDELDMCLGYVVPIEGSNVWFDGFVMPKTVSDAKAEKAVEFLNYISAPENAIRNMEYIGYTSVISGEEIFDWLVDYYELETESQAGYKEVDLNYFFDVEFNFSGGDYEQGDYVVYIDEEEDGRQLYAQYSTWDTIKRCAIMDNFNDEALTRVNKMWNRVKFVTLSTTAIVLIIVFFVLGVLAIIAYKNKDQILAWKIIEKLKPKKKKQYEVVKVEKIN